MSKFLSGRQSNLNLGIESYTEGKTVLQTTGKVGIGTTNAQQHSLYVVGSTNITDEVIVGGGLTAVGIGSFQNDVYIDQQLYVAGVNISGGAVIGEDITTRNLSVSGFSTFTDSADFNNDIDVDGHTELDNVNVSGVATIRNLVVPSGGEFDVYDTLSVFHGNVEIAGDLTINGDQTVVNVQSLNILDKEIVLGIGTTPGTETDFSANHGGIAIASTEGSPLVPFTVAGFNTLPDTYKQIMWVKQDTYGVGTTDAWLFNYAVGIGSTLVPNGVRFAVSEIQFTDNEITARKGNIDYIDALELKVTGVSTFTNGPVLIGSGTSTGTINQTLQVTGGAYISTYVGIGFTDPFSNLAIYDPDGSWISLVDPGASSATFENNDGKLYIRAEQGSGNSEIIFQTGTSNYEQKPSVSGSDRVIIDNTGNLLIDQATTTGTGDQRLQVGGGAYVSGYMGIGITNPTTNLYIVGNEYVTGIITARQFVGDVNAGVITSSLITTTDLNVTGVATVNSLYVGGSEVISESTAVFSDTTLNQLKVLGVSTFVGTIDANDGATIDNIQIGVSNNNEIDTVTGNLTLDSNAGTVNIDDQLSVIGIATFQNKLHLLDNDRLHVGGAVGDAGDLQIYHNGLDSYIQDLGTGNLRILGDNIEIGTSGGISEIVATTGGSVDLYYDGAKKLETTGYGVTVYETLQAPQINITGIGTVNQLGINTLTVEHLNATDVVVSGVSTFQGDIHLGDSDTAYFGSDDDLSIFHDGGAAYIDNNTGILFYQAGQHFFKNAAGTETFASFVGDSSVSLYYDNLKKFETVSTGATVTGTVYAQNFSTGNAGVGINISSDTITGPSSITIDPSAIGDNTGYVRIKGDLFVDGEQFVVNSTTIELGDFNVGIATTVGSNNLLDGAGIGIGSTNIRKTLTYDFSSDALKSSENFDLATGKVYKINEVEVLSSNQLTVPDINAIGVVTVGVTSATTLYVAGVSTFVGSVNFNNDIDVDGHTELDNVNISGVTTFVGSADFNNDIDVDGHAELDQLNVSGVSTFVGLVDVNGGLTANIATVEDLTDNRIVIVGAGGRLEDDGNLTFDGSNLTIGVDLDVDGHTELDNVNISGIVTAYDLDVDGHTELDNVNVSGVSTFVGITTNESTIFATQLSVSGLSTFVGVGTFNNDLYVGNNLDVNGDINFNGSLFQNNQPFIASRWTAASNGLDIYRLSGVGIGTSTINAVLTVGGDTEISGVVTARQFVGGINAGIATLGITTAETLDVYTSTRLRGQIKDNFDNAGTSTYVLTSGGPSGNWSWQPVTAVGAGTLNGISIREEGGTVGTALSITAIDFRGSNVTAIADPQPNGIATVTFSDTPTFDSLNVSGLSTFVGVATAQSTLFANQLSVAGVSTFQGNVNLGDNDRLRLGDNNDLQIYSDGSNAFIKETIGSGSLYIDATNLVFREATGSEKYAQFNSNSSVDLYYDNSKKFETTAGGVDITGHTETDTLNVSGVSTFAGTISAVDANFTGNVTIGGTLTYEDVTNIDSVGIITARSDVRVGGNLSSVGITTLASAGGITTTGGDLYVNDDIFFKGNLYQDGRLFTAGIGIGSTATNPQSGVISQLARVGTGFTDINFVGTGLSVTGYGTTLVVDFGNISGGAGSRVSISSEAPSSPQLGDLWWGSETGDLKVYYEDVDSAQWVDANSGSQSLAIISDSSPVGSGITSAGTLWWDSTYGVLKVYYDDGDSEQWVDTNSGAYINYWTGRAADKISTDYNVGIGTTNPTERLQVDGNISINNQVSYGTTTAVTASTSQVAIHSSLAIASYRSVEYTIQATQGSNFHTTKILALHDGSSAYHTEYGSIFNNAAVSTYDVDVSGGNMRLLATPASASTTNFKVVFNGIKD
jgi:hypothetical protein